MNDVELSGYEVVVGEPDVRGWEVVGRDGHRIGEVEDLLAEAEGGQARFLRVRVDRRPGEDLAAEVPPTGGTERAGIPELDSLREGDEVIGHVTVPGRVRPEAPARTVGEALVRDSLLDVENRMTADQAGGFRETGERLIPFDRAHLEPERHRVRLG